MKKSDVFYVKLNPVSCVLGPIGSRCVHVSDLFLTLNVYNISPAAKICFLRMMIHKNSFPAGHFSFSFHISFFKANGVLRKTAMERILGELENSNLLTRLDSLA